MDMIYQYDNPKIQVVCNNKTSYIIAIFWNKRLTIFIINFLLVLNNDFSKQLIVKFYKAFFYLYSCFKKIVF